MSLNDDMTASRMEAALMAAGDIAYDWDLSSDRIAWRGRLDETVGITDPAALATGKALAGRINPEDLAARQFRINDHFAGAAAFDCDYRLRGEDGHFHWVQDRGRAERDGAGRAVRVVGIMRVITSRKALEFRLDRLAKFDELTGLANKLRLRDEIGAIAERSAESGRSGTYLPLGIDKMTMINDPFGCEAADARLAQSP